MMDAMRDVAPAIPAVIYARYSSHAQNDASIEQQVADCEAYARANNLQVLKVYPDRHLTGTSDQRQQFQAMIRDAAHARWRYVLVWKMDRFARNRYDSATYKYRLKKHGIRVLSVKESIPDGPEGILLEAVLEGSAEYYSANLSQNIKRGMHSNALECKVNGGKIPYGYCRGTDGRFAIAEGEADVVREIFRKSADGCSYAALCNDLNARGVRTKNGALWNKNSFRHMLQNEAYVGVYSYGGVRVENGMPPIVDRPLFLQAQGRIERRQHVRGRSAEDEYMLTGKLFCGYCDAPMIGCCGFGKNGQKYYYYACQTRRQSGGCKKENVSRDWLEGAVFDAAMEIVLRDDVVEWIADQVMAYQEREGNSATMLSLRSSLLETRAAIDNVMKAIEAGIITATTKRRLQELEAEGVRLENAIALEEAAITRLERDQVVYWLQRFRSGDRNDKAFRRRLIDTFISSIWLWDDHLRIAFNYTGASPGSRAIADRSIVTVEPGCSPTLSIAPPFGCQANTLTVYFTGKCFVLVQPLRKR